MRIYCAAVFLSVFLLFAFGCSKQAANNTSNRAAPNSAADNSNSATKGQSAVNDNGAQAQAPAPMIVPVGKALTVRLAQAVGSKISEPGQRFSATIARDVVVNGQVVIPAGTAVSGTVVDARPLGHFAGGARLQLKLTSVKLNGANEAIRTNSIERVIKGKGKRTGIMAGGGALFGAVVGGLAAGPKGAMIGAAAGGAAGTAGSAATGNREIYFPAEAALTFQLTRPLQIE